ncbi:DUF2442 domain-containing protein [Lentibacillus salicampi]|uniref:DUF2442 domain-containing protein n=1 Tax=Lentibacillus salicampi TaxID=175306 RepID=A0A4Y9AEG3_9BACI|nr:DUF2442 domain-containing protein [Lentibacillus salicampi]TFJ94203.1 DUF2442 domain-containing protein [Lentibacillus salicampi]
MREIVQAKPVPTLSGWLLCKFDKGEKRFVDMRLSMEGVLKKLSDPEVFEQVYVDEEAGTVAAPDELHVDPDTLYTRGINIKEIQNLADAANSDQNGDWLERA